MSSNSGSASASVTVRLDQRSPLRRIWRYVGYDEPNYTYTPNGHALLSKLADMSDGPYYVRCHFILCSGDGSPKLKWGSTNVYTEDEDGEPVYDWDLIDRILDSYVALGLIPFVELGFTPEALSTAPEGAPYDDPRQGGWRYPPRDYGRWLELVRNLAAHCRQRYGLAEVSKWYWELWNEPDIFYWTGTVEEYCRLYDYTVAGHSGRIAPGAHRRPGHDIQHRSSRVLRISARVSRACDARNQSSHRRDGNSHRLHQLSRKRRRIPSESGCAQRDAVHVHVIGQRGRRPRRDRRLPRVGQGGDHPFGMRSRRLGGGYDP